MRVVVVGASGGIGSQVAYLLKVGGHEVLEYRRPDQDERIYHLGAIDAVVCCNGSIEPLKVWESNYETTRKWWISKCPKVFVALSGGGVGGPGPYDTTSQYRASKAAIVSFVEVEADRHPDHQLFCVAPGLTATKMTGYKGADPRIPAAFIVKLLSGKYGHLSGSLLAAQRDDLDTMKPMKLRRVECP